MKDLRMLIPEAEYEEKQELVRKGYKFETSAPTKTEADKMAKIWRLNGYAVKILNFTSCFDLWLKKR